MQEFLAPIFFRVENIIKVLSTEIAQVNIDNIIYISLNGLVVFFFFYFISKWFKAYIIRVCLFFFGAWVLWQVSAKNSILYSFDLYGGLGLLIPHLEIPSLTYLIIKYRTLYLYDKTVEYFLFLTAPLIWCYKKIVELIYFIKTQQKDKTNKQTDENYNYEEFKKQQKAEWEKEQAKADKQYQNKSKNKRDKQQNQNNYQKTEYSKKSKEESKENSRWDSTDPYIILDIHTTATKEEIKKAYRLLAKIYHPDLALIEKERYTKIFQKINWAYNILK